MMFQDIIMTAIHSILQILLLTTLLSIHIITVTFILLATAGAASLAFVCLFYLGSYPMSLVVKLCRRIFWYPLVIRFETMIEIVLQLIFNVEFEIDLSGGDFFWVLFELVDVSAMCGAMVVCWRILIQCWWVVEIVDGYIEDPIGMLEENGWVMAWLPLHWIEMAKCAREDEGEALVMLLLGAMELGLGTFLVQRFRERWAKAILK